MMAHHQSTIKLIGLVFIFRLINALLCRSYFQADEYYQSLEIAHRIVFGYGYQTWEWKPTTTTTGGIRSPIHVFVFLPAYWLVNLLGLHQSQLLIILPKIIQAGIATITDLATYSLAGVLLTPFYANAALACSLASFFNAYAGVRTLSNSFETALIASALAYWPWDANGILDSWTQSTISISLAAISVIVRPSAILFWSVLSFRLLKNSRGEARMDIIALFAVIGVISALGCFLIDSSFYGQPTFTPLNFIRQNVSNNISSFYGINRWHFYFTQAFTFVNLSLFPTVILGMILLSNPQCLHESPQQLIRLRAARFAILGTMIGLSFLKHKEFRFIQPLLPLFNCFAARAMVNNYIKYRQSHPATDPGEVKYLERLLLCRPLGFLLRSVIGLGAAFYLMSFHYRAQVSVMDYLRHIPDQDLKSVGFLMPCHSTPWQSHLHKPHLASNSTQERLWMLTCEPPLAPIQNISSLNANDTIRMAENENQTHRDSEPQKVETSETKLENNTTSDYQDEADRFYADPEKFLLTRFPERVDERFPASERSLGTFQWPSHLVIFQALWKLDQVRSLLQARGYQVIWEAANGKWHDDPLRRAGSVMVLQYRT